MATELNNLEKAINSGLATAVKSSTIRFNQLTIEVEIEDIKKTILFLKTNEKCKFRQLIDITAVDYPEKEKRFKLVYLLLSHEKNFRLIINSNINEKNKIITKRITSRTPIQMLLPANLLCQFWGL